MADSDSRTNFSSATSSVMTVERSPVHTPQAVGEYHPPAETLKVDPVRRARAVLHWISWAESTYAHEQI